MLIGANLADAREGVAPGARRNAPPLVGKQPRMVCHAPWRAMHHAQARAAVLVRVVCDTRLDVHGRSEVASGCRIA